MRPSFKGNYLLRNYGIYERLHHFRSEAFETKVKDLIAKGENLDEKNASGTTLLIDAAHQGYSKIVEILVSGGANVNATNSVNGKSALYEASTNGYLEIVKYLYEASADINAKDSEGITPLMMASFGGHIDLVKYLVDNGADVNTEIQGRTALDVAKQRGQQDLVDLLNSAM